MSNTLKSRPKGPKTAETDDDVPTAKDALKYAASNTSCHGFDDLVRASTWFSRAFWVIVIVGCAVAAGYQVVEHIIKYYQFPVATSFEEVSKAKMELPPITICPMEPFVKKKADNLDLDDSLATMMFTAVLHKPVGSKEPTPIELEAVYVSYSMRMGLLSVVEAMRKIADVTVGTRADKMRMQNVILAVVGNISGLAEKEARDLAFAEAIDRAKANATSGPDDLLEATEHLFGNSTDSISHWLKVGCAFLIVDTLYIPMHN